MTRGPGPWYSTTVESREERVKGAVAVPKLLHDDIILRATRRKRSQRRKATAAGVPRLHKNSLLLYARLSQLRTVAASLRPSQQLSIAKDHVPSRSTSRCCLLAIFGWGAMANQGPSATAEVGSYRLASMINDPVMMPRDSASPTLRRTLVIVNLFLEMSGWFTLFTNARYVLNGKLVEDHLVISDESGLILKREGYIGGEAVDLDDNIIAPGFLELHTNGVKGFHFTQFENEQSYAKSIDDVARHYTTQGVTGFWATIPTVKGEKFHKVRHSIRVSISFFSYALSQNMHCIAV